MENDWLARLKAGDEVIYSHYGEYKVSVVEKITPTGLIRVQNRLFNKDGSARGEMFGGHLIECTAERKENIQKEEFVRLVWKEMRNLKRLSYKQAVEIKKILDSECESQE